MTMQATTTNPKSHRPLVRLTGENGFVIYPKMVPDGSGGWKMADPKSVAEALGTPKTRLNKS